MYELTAEMFARKVRALKHCIKLLNKIDKEGQATIALNCTGVTFEVQKDDALYLKIATTKAQLEEEVKSYAIVQRSKKKYPFPPAPEKKKKNIRKVAVNA